MFCFVFKPSLYTYCGSLVFNFLTNKQAVHIIQQNSRHILLSLPIRSFLLKGSETGNVPGRQFRMSVSFLHAVDYTNAFRRKKEKKIEKATKSPMYHHCMFHIHIRQELKLDHIVATTACLRN